MKNSELDNEKVMNDEAKPAGRKNSIYMICVLVLLVVVAVVSFIMDKKINTPEENGAEEEIIEENTSLTVYGEVSREELFAELRNAIVRIEVKVPGSTNADTTILGSGVILGITDTYIDIATASHVVELTAKPLVYFADGSLAYGSVLAYGKMSDVAFVRVEAEALSEGIGESLSFVQCAENADYAALEAEDAVYMIGSSTAVAVDVKEGIVKETAQFIELFQNNMLVCECSVSAGMSGGGSFDEEGKLIGIIVGTNGADAVSVAVTDVMAEYRSISL